MMRLLVLATLLAASAAEAQSGGLLAVSPAPLLAFDAGLGDRAEPLPAGAPAGPRTRGMRRGAKIGALVGVATGVVAYSALRVRNRPCDFLCEWDVAAALAVPLTAITAATGAVIGAVAARPEEVPTPRRPASRRRDAPRRVSPSPDGMAQGRAAQP